MSWMKPTWKDAVSSSVSSSSWIVQSRPGPGRSAAATPPRPAPSAGDPADRAYLRRDHCRQAGSGTADRRHPQLLRESVFPQAEQRHLLDGEIGQMGGKSSWPTGIRARIRSVSGSAVLRLSSCRRVSRPDPTDLYCSCVMPHRHLARLRADPLTAHALGPGSHILPAEYFLIDGICGGSACMLR
jgi:hypothetical protein